MPTIAQFNQDVYAATDEVRCISIYIPDDDSYLPLLAGLLSLGGTVTSYIDPQSAQAEGVAAVWRDAYIQTDWTGCVTPAIATSQSRVSLWHRWAQIEVGNALQIVIDATQLFNHYVRQNTPANGDTTYQLVWLTAGDYAMRVLYQRANAGGKVSWIFEHVETNDSVAPIVDADLSGTTLANQVLSATFTLTESGMYKMYTFVSGAGSVGAGFFCPLQVTEVWKTAEP